MQFRKGEKQKTQSKDSARANPKFKRSARFLQTEDGWYFRTRESILVGPYPSEWDCELGASLITARLAQLDASEDPVSAIREFLVDPISGPLSHKHEAARAENAEKARSVDIGALKAAARRQRVTGFLKRMKSTLTKGKRGSKSVVSRSAKRGASQA